MQARYYQLSDYVTDVQTLIHDAAAVDYTVAQLTTIINKARFRVAEDCRCVRQMIVGLNTVTQQEQYPLTDFVGGLSVVSGGQNYSAAPTIAVAGGGSGTAVVSGGVIVGASLNLWMPGVLTPPAVTITDPTGTGAVISAVNPTSILDLYLITAQQSFPAAASTLALTFSWLPFDAFQAFCRSYRATYSWPGAYTVHYGPVNPLSQQANAQRVYMYPIPNQVLPLEWDAITLPNTLFNQTDVDYWMLQPWTDAVRFYAAHECFLGLQQYGQAKAMLALYEGRTRQLPSTIRARRVHNFYYRYRAMMRRI